MDDITELRIEYSYYNKTRVTPIFINNDDLLALTFDGFNGLVIKEVPHFKKISSDAMAIRMTIVDECNSDIDISTKYFSSQIRSFLNKGMKIILVRVAAAESPVAVTTSVSTENVRKPKCVISQSRRCLNLQTNTSITNINTSPSTSPTSSGYPQISIINTIPEPSGPSAKSKQESPPVVLPLERYVKKQAMAVQTFSDELASKTNELAALDSKLRKACDQNQGHLNACGNCHPRLGHTRKACDFSPCRSAFSCGMLSKHNDQKSKRAALVKNISQLEGKLTSANKDVESAKKAVEKIQNSSQKRIEDILLEERPRRYVVNGLRNWLQLNKDVALLQSKLRGTLPTRDNVMNLLRSVVNSSHEGRTSATATKSSSTALRDTDHRMLPQKRILENEYSIEFPTKKCCPDESGDAVIPNNQEISDFKLALKLQQDELEWPRDDEPASFHFQACNESSACIVNQMQSDEEETIAEDTAATALLSLKSCTGNGQPVSNANEN